MSLEDSPVTRNGRMPAFMIPHGAGPCFFMNPRPGPPGMWDGMEAFLRGIATTLPERPRAVLVISAHWETPGFAVNGAAQHGLLFDYYNFPEHTYRLTYPAAGAPELAQQVRTLLTEAGLPCEVEAERGLDHGVFVPFLLIYPDADIPVVQLSLRESLDPAEHLRMGRALETLRDQGVLIVGSGMTYHNTRGGQPEDVQRNASAFDQWLQETVELSEPSERAARLADWAAAPGGRFCHPREEHLLPLMVVAGAAGDDAGSTVYAERLGGRTPNSGFRFG